MRLAAATGVNTNACLLSNHDYTHKLDTTQETTMPTFKVFVQQFVEETAVIELEATIFTARLQLLNAGSTRVISTGMTETTLSGNSFTP